MLQKMTAAAAAAFAISALSMSAGHATTLTLGGGWETFFWVNPGNPDPQTFGGPIMDAISGDTDFTFTVTSHADLKITDAFYNLDMFDLVVTGPGGTVDEGHTTFVLAAPFDYTEDFDVAYADPNFSKGGYAVGPGTYTVTGTTIFSPYGYGVGGIELSTPEPATWAMMLLGFGAIGGLVRRRARALATIA